MTPPALRPDTLVLEGLVLRCSLAGTVVAVVHDATGVGVEVGDSLAGFLAPADHDQALRYLGEVATGDGVGTVWWPLTAVDGSIQLLQVVGARVDGDGSGPGPWVQLVAAPGPQALDALLTAFSRIAPGMAADMRRRTFPEPAPGFDAEHELFRAVSDANAELLRMHRELASDHARIESAYRHQQLALAMVAHDLRNPLAAISGFSGHLQRTLTDVEGQSALLLRRIEALGRRGLRLVEDLLDLSSIERGELRIEPLDTDVCEVAAEVIAGHAAAADAKGVPISLACPPSGIVARVDPARFFQVLDNLVSNAVKFTPAQQGGIVEVACHRMGDALRVRVRDHGVGIDPAIRPRVFEPFTRAGALGADGEPSTGLGLSIVGLLVEAHQGQVRIESTPGKGTTVEVLLPLHGPVTSDTVE